MPSMGTFAQGRNSTRVGKRNHKRKEGAVSLHANIAPVRLSFSQSALSYHSNVLICSSDPIVYQSLFHLFYFLCSISPIDFFIHNGLLLYVATIFPYYFWCVRLHLNDSLSGPWILLRLVRAVHRVFWWQNLLHSSGASSCCLWTRFPEVICHLNCKCKVRKRGKISGYRLDHFRWGLGSGNAGSRTRNACWSVVGGVMIRAK